MNAYNFFVTIGRLYEKRKWRLLEDLLSRPHPLLPGEREIYLELCEHQVELGHKPRVRLDPTGMHIVSRS